MHDSYRSDLAHEQITDGYTLDHIGFKNLSAIIKNRAGINLPLSDKNLTLMFTRIKKHLIKYSKTSFHGYFLHIRSNQSLMDEFLFSMTTNTTHFFREDDHFKVLQKLLPELLSRNKKNTDPEFRIWCAAASSGQEPYSIAMTLLEFLEIDQTTRIKFLASDIDPIILDKAMKGVYRKQDMDKVSKSLILKYFKKLKEKYENEIHYQVKGNLKDIISFAEFNLQEKQYPFNTPFDLIFCRNVLIYFDAPTVHSTVTKLANSLKLGGYLFLGHSEGANIQVDNLNRVSHAVYQRIK